MGERVTVRWEFDSSREDFEQKRGLRRRLMMRRVALTLAFLAIAAIVAVVLAVMFTARDA